MRIYFWNDRIAKLSFKSFEERQYLKCFIYFPNIFNLLSTTITKKNWFNKNSKIFLRIISFFTVLMKPEKYLQRKYTDLFEFIATVK